MSRPSIKPECFTHLEQFGQDDKTSLFSSVLSADDLQTFQNQHKFRDRKLSPSITLTLFIQQVISSEKSCTSIMHQHAKAQFQQGNRLDILSDAAWCKARKRLNQKALSNLLRTTGLRMKNSVPSAWNWHGRQVLMIDGTDYDAPDTEKNQKKYPQHVVQKEHCGNPKIKSVMLMSVATGAVIDVKWAACKGKLTGETSLFQRLYGSLEENQILLGDAAYENWFALYELGKRSVDCVFEKNGSRSIDFRKCHQKIAQNDAIFKLKKPQRIPSVSLEEYQKMPKEITVRAIKDKARIIVTTLLGAKKYSAASLKNSTKDAGK